MVVQNLSMTLREEVLDSQLRSRIGSIGLRSHGRGIAEIVLEVRLVLHAGLLNLLNLLHAILLCDNLCLVLRIILRRVTKWLLCWKGSVVSAQLLRLL